MSAAEEDPSLNPCFVSSTQDFAESQCFHLSMERMPFSEGCWNDQEKHGQMVSYQAAVMMTVISLAPFFKKNCWFIYLAAPDLRCRMWALVPWPGIEPGPPALGVWSGTSLVGSCLFWPVVRRASPSQISSWVLQNCFSVGDDHSFLWSYAHSSIHYFLHSPNKYLLITFYVLCARSTAPALMDKCVSWWEDAVT